MSIGLRSLEGTPERIGQNLIPLKLSPTEVEVRDNAGDLITNYFYVGKKPLDAPKTSRSSIFSTCLQAAGAALITVASVIPFTSILDQKHAAAKEPNLPDQNPKKPLEVKGGLPSQQLITSYSAEDMNAVGADRLIGLITDPLDNGRYVVELENDEVGNSILQDKWKIPFFALTVDASQTDTKLKAAAGDQTRRAALGRLGLTRDDTNWKVYNLDGYTIIDIKFTPDNKYINTLVSDPGNDNLPVNFRFDIERERFERLMECIGCILGGTQTPLTASQGGTLKNYSFLNLYQGYIENTYFPDGTITSRQLNADEGFHGTRKLPQVKDSQGRNIIWVLNNDTSGILPNNPNEGFGTAYPNIDNVKANYVVQGRGNFYPSGLGVLFGALALDLPADAVYGGMQVFGYTTNGNHPLSAFVEYMPYSDSTNLSKRILIWNDGEWINQTGNDWIEIPFLNTVSKASKKQLLGSLVRHGWVYDPATQTNDREFRDGSLLERDITNGLSPTKQWKRVPVRKRPVSREFLPKVSRN